MSVSSDLEHETRFKTSSVTSNSNEDTYLLSQEEIDSYNENGFLIIKNLFDITTLNNLRKRFIDICNGRVKTKAQFVKERNLMKTHSNPEDYVYKIQDILDDEVFMSYSEHPRLLHIVSQFVGDEISALNSMLINKPPDASRHPPHQDLFYFPIRPATIIGSWTAVDYTILENGCLFCIPGSHKTELLPHGRFTGAKRFFHVIKDEFKYAPLDKRVYFEMNPGDTIFIHPLLIHGSGANTTKNYRKAMTVHYMSNKCRYVDLKGTVQEPLIEEFHDYVQKDGYPESYQHLWKLKSKIIRGNITSHL